MAGPDDLEEPTPAIRVLITDLPEPIAALVAVLIETQQDMMLVERVQDNIELLLAAKDIDILILGALQLYPPPGICSHLLSEYPELRIMLLTPDGDRSMLYWRGLRRRRLDSRSLKRVVSNIRDGYQLNSTV